MKFRNLICLIFGHRSKVISQHVWLRDNEPWASIAILECECCGKTKQINWNY